MKTRSRARRALLATCAIALAVPAAAQADPTISRLRVEAEGRAASPGVSYVTDSTRVPHGSGTGQCGRFGGSQLYEGPTALGLVIDGGRTNARLRPVRTIRYDFGLFLCGIHDDVARPDFSSFWSLRVNHAESSVGGSQRLSRGDEALWFLVDTNSGRNTGREIVLRAPARARPGEPIGLQTLLFDANGNSKPAPGIEIIGDAHSVTGPDGRTVVTATEEGRFALRARRGHDIPSAVTAVCVRERLVLCPRQRGERIVGSPRGDRIVDTAGGDDIVARSGNDRIDVREGDRDVVRCGSGRDIVYATRGDAVARDCEVLRGTARRFAG